MMVGMVVVAVHVDDALKDCKQNAKVEARDKKFLVRLQSLRQLTGAAN